MKHLIVFAAIVLLLACKKTNTSPDHNPALPPIEATVASHTGAYSIDLSARMKDFGNYSITEAGFVINVSHLPSVDRNVRLITIEPDANGNVSATVTKLLPSTTYYARMYAKNESGVVYGEEVSFSTLNEKVFHGNAILTTQQEVETFARERYNHVSGELMITGTVTDLTPLMDLSTIIGKLDISFTTQLLSLNGLENIQRVNTQKTPTGINITFNDVLQNLQGLEGILATFGEVTVFRNYGLTSLEGLDNLTSIESGKLRIDDCDKLTNLHGLENLAGVYKEVTISNNDLLTNVSALQKLSTTRSLLISSNASLTNIDGLTGIRELQYLGLYYNHNLSDIKGLMNLQTADKIQIDSNNLATLAGFENVTSINVLFLENSSELTDLSALSNLSSAKYLVLRKTGVVDMTGFAAITSTVNIDLYYNTELASLEGLNNIQQVESALNIVGNPKLTDIHAISNVTRAYSLHFEHNALLADFCPLKALLSSMPAVSLTTLNNAANPNRNEVIANCP